MSRQPPTQQKPKKKQGEIAELQQSLNDTRIDLKKEAVRKIIDAMTRGKDVSMLFPEMIKNMETSNMELKKLIYLYVLNYAKTQPDLAILGINSFRKDGRDKTNPFLRALAVRTMGCIRVKHIVEYLLDPLKAAIKDEDSYVRKTSAICIGKLYDLNPELMEEQGFLKFLEKLVNDGNAMVVANAIATQQRISELRGEQLVSLTSYTVQKLLTALSDCNEWGAIYILDALTNYNPSDAKETESILDRISSRLSHQNPGVVLSATKLIMKYLDLLSNPDSVRMYQKKLTAPLISLLSSESEIQYISLKNINLILQKRPNILEKELKIFFCNFNDPIYIKMQKLEILIRLANTDNIPQILHELKEYTQEVDVEYVRKAVNAIGRCAIKLEKTAEKCVTVLYECLKTKVSYVVQETIIVIRDIFRKYPRKYERILKDLCENLKNLDDPEAKASMIWIIGEYVDTIENADQLLYNFAENFTEEQSVVQHQIIQSSLKLFLMRPNDGYDLVQSVLKKATNEVENPDLRDRAYIYWRLLNKDVELTKKIVYSDRPAISDSSYTMETELLDKLIENIGNLASVYYQPPEKFVKRIRDSQNLREQEELEDIQAGEEFLQDIGQDADQYGDVQIQAEDDNNQQTNNNNNDLMQSTVSQSNNNMINQENEIDLLGMDDMPSQNNNQQQQQPQQQQQQQQNINQGQDLMGDMDLLDSQMPSQQQQQQQQQPQNNNQDVLAQPSNFNNAKIPLTKVVSADQYSKSNKVNGLEVSAAFQQEGQTIYLYLQVINQSPSHTFDQFGLNFNANSFKLAPVVGGIGNIKIGALAPGQKASNKLEVNNQGKSDNQPPGTPFTVQIAMHTDLDIFIFTVPCSFSCLLIPSDTLSPQQYQELVPKMKTANDSIPSDLAKQSNELKQRMANNHFQFVGSRTNQAGIEMISFSTKVINELPMLIDIILDTPNNRLNLRYFAPHESMLPNYLQALKFIFK